LKALQLNRLPIPLAVALIAGLFSSFQRLVFFTSLEWLYVGYAFAYNFMFSLFLWWLADGLGKRLRLWQKIILVYLIGFIVMSAVSYTFYQWSNQWILPVRLTDRRNPGQDIAPYLFQIQPLRSFTLITAVLLIQYTMQLLGEKQRIQLENERLKRENLNAQLEAIRQQINPHFFFNTLNTLKTLVKANKPEALPYIIQLSNVFRYLLRLQQQPWVTLDEELQFLKAYLFLLEIRFGDGLLVQVAVPEAILTTRIPPATLQLLVENAVKHNVVSAARPLRIQIEQVDDQHVRVENNLQPKRTPEPSNEYGLQSLNNRYTYLCGQGIEVDQTDTSFRVLLPLLDCEPPHENAHH